MRLKRGWRVAPSFIPSAAKGLSLLLVVLSGLCGITGAQTRRPELRDAAAADGACFPVNGSGQIVSRGVTAPIGPLAPVFAGDTVIVHVGTVTLVDFRSGVEQVLAAGTRFVMPPVPPGARRSGSRPWWIRIHELFLRSVHGSDARRIGGSVRGGLASFWPDTARFALDVAVVFRWKNVNPVPEKLWAVGAAGDTVTAELSEEARAHSGGTRWPSRLAVKPGPVRWALLDRDGDRLGGGGFEFLTAAQVDSSRDHYRQEARRILGDDPQGLGAALLAAAERCYLW